MCKGDAQLAKRQISRNKTAFVFFRDRCSWQWLKSASCKKSKIEP